MRPQDSTIYVYGIDTRTIDWLTTYRMPYVNIIDPYRADIYIPPNHRKIIQQCNDKRVCLFIGQYSSHVIFQFEELQHMLNTDTHAVVTQLSALSLKKKEQHKNTSVVIPGMCPARNVKDNRPCTYASHKNGYCGTHYKCSLKRLRVCIYYDKPEQQQQQYVKDMALRTRLLNIQHVNPHTTENIEIGIFETFEYISKDDSKHHQRLLLSNITRPLIVVGWGHSMKCFSTVEDCVHWSDTLPSLTRCCSINDSGTQCEQLCSQSKTLYCKHHAGGFVVNVIPVKC